MSSKWENNIHLSIPFSSIESASMVCDILSVDQELVRGSVQRQISTVGENLTIDFQSEDLKKLRVSLNSIFKSIILIQKTIELFES